MLGAEVRDLLECYAPSDAREDTFRARMLALVGEPAPFARSTFAPGHFTASAFVLSPERDALLLIHHRKLGLWLQPGGHVEATDSTVEGAARREATEEVGLTDFDARHPGIFDIDVHSIPGRADEPEHEHFDLRVLLVARSLEFAAGDEVLGARWVALADMPRMTTDESVQRAVRKIHRVR
jgi:8-oxo-dGTP pyrophosphatase MutT (NUDIX family)